MNVIRKLPKKEVDHFITFFSLAYNIDINNIIIKWVEHAGKTYNIIHYYDEIQILEVEMKNDF